jgi:hypothetical protein
LVISNLPEGPWHRTIPATQHALQEACQLPFRGNFSVDWRILPCDPLSRGEKSDTLAASRAHHVTPDWSGVHHVSGEKNAQVDAGNKSGMTKLIVLPNG